MDDYLSFVKPSRIKVFPRTRNSVLPKGWFSVNQHFLLEALSTNWILLLRIDAKREQQSHSISFSYGTEVTGQKPLRVVRDQAHAINVQDC